MMSLTKLLGALLLTAAIPACASSAAPESLEASEQHSVVDHAGQREQQQKRMSMPSTSEVVKVYEGPALDRQATGVDTWTLFTGVTQYGGGLVAYGTKLSTVSRVLVLGYEHGQLGVYARTMGTSPQGPYDDDVLATYGKELRAVVSAAFEGASPERSCMTEALLPARLASEEIAVPENEVIAGSFELDQLAASMLDSAGAVAARRIVDQDESLGVGVVDSYRRGGPAMLESAKSCLAR